MKTLWLLQIAVQIVLLCKLWRSNLFGPHRMFFCWLACEALRSLVLLAAGDARYRTIWLYFAPALMILQFGTVVEFARRALEDYPGIAKFAPRLLISVSGLAILLVIASAAPDLSLIKPGASILIAQRYVATALALIPAALLVFFAIVAPTAARRPNTRAHGYLLAIYFGAIAIGYAWHNATNAQQRESVNAALALVSTLCLVLWAILLRPSGEAIPPIVARHDDSGSPRDQLEKVLRAAERVWKSKL